MSRGLAPNPEDACVHSVCMWRLREGHVPLSGEHLRRRDPKAHSVLETRGMALNPGSATKDGVEMESCGRMSPPWAPVSSLVGWAS